MAWGGDFSGHLHENLTLTSVFIKSVARDMHGSRGWGPELSLEFENFTYKKVISGFFGELDPPPPPCL